MSTSKYFALGYAGLLLLLSGCSGTSAPVPDEQQQLTDTVAYLKNNIQQFKAARNLSSIESEIPVMLETLQASADQYGSTFTELRDAGDKFYADFKAASKKQDKVAVLESFESQLQQFASRSGG